MIAPSTSVLERLTEHDLPLKSSLSKKNGGLKAAIFQVDF
jgi:hypothetical protein